MLCVKMSGSTSAGTKLVRVAESEILPLVQIVDLTPVFLFPYCLEG
jgi:hypothetical protein